MSTGTGGASELVPSLPPPLQLFLLSEGVVISTALVLAAELGIADLLAEGPQTSEQLARSTSTHEGSLYRVLRLLASLGVFSEVEPRRFALTPVGECLRSHTPGSMRSWVRMVGLGIWSRTFAQALQSLRTGGPVFQRVLGAELFDYLPEHPEEARIFNTAMTDFSRGVSAAVVQAYDFRGIGKVVDVGGGHGTLVTTILQAHPEMTGVLFDLPHVVEGARALVAELGLTARCEVVGGDFFQSVPTGGDAYLLSWIIHDWEQRRALEILCNCRRAMKPAGRLLLMEAVIPPGDRFHPGKLVDFVMLVALGGQERTEEEYAQLLRDAGFRLARIVPTNSAMSVIEALPA